MAIKTIYLNWEYHIVSEEGLQGTYDTFPNALNAAEKFANNYQCDVDVTLNSQHDYRVLATVKHTPLLTKEEKEFLKLSLKFEPYKINAISWHENHYFLLQGVFDYTCSQKFSKDAFKGLTKGKKYTLKELGLED